MSLRVAHLDDHTARRSVACEEPPHCEGVVEDRNAVARTLMKTIEHSLWQGDKFQFGISALEHFWSSTRDDAISIMSCAENVCDERGRKKFAVETKRGTKVAELGRFIELQENQDRHHCLLQEVIEHMITKQNTKQNRIWATMERTHKLMNGASGENPDVLEGGLGLGG